MEFTVRSMTPQDLPAVRCLAEASEYLSFLEWETNEVLIEALQTNADLSQVAQNKSTGEVVGAAFFGSTGLRAKFQHLVVSPSCRRQGIGHAMVERTIALFCQRSKVRRLVCTVRSANTQALEFWKREGFVVTSGLDGRVAFLIRDL